MYFTLLEGIIFLNLYFTLLEDVISLGVYFTYLEGILSLDLRRYVVFNLDTMKAEAFKSIVFSILHSIIKYM